MRNEPLISIVMPAWNAADHIQEAIDSVLRQTWTNWELLVVDNASSDGTSAIVERVGDPRIRLLHQPVKGVGHARNTALQNLSGDFYCFLDADDILPPTSLADRAGLLLADEQVHFADGGVQAFTSGRTNVWTRSPSYRGNAPLRELYTISGSCFLGTTWMIRRTTKAIPLFNPEMSHAEELFYYMTIAHHGAYDHVSRPVLFYRIRPGSAMTDIKGLHKGYRQLMKAMCELPDPPREHEARLAWRRIRHIMARTYLKRKMPLTALCAFLESRPKPGAVPKIMP